MNIKLSEHFDYKKMILFTLPSMAMMVFTSIYGVVDGFFVSNFVGKTPFAAVNFIMPVLMILGTLGFMFGTGGGALIAKTLGEGKNERANRQFSLFVYVSLVLGVVLTVVSIIFLRSLAELLGADGKMLDDAVLYGRIVLCSLPFLILQFEFHSYFIVAEKPQMGLYVTLASGITNMILDALFMAVFKWGIAGAAWATALSQALSGIIPLVYFSRPNTSLLHFVKTSFDKKALIRACVNGSSELMSNISMSLVGMLYNIQLLKYAGENGVAAYGVIMYVNFVFIAIFIGFSTGIAPVISFHFGAKNHMELKGLLKRSFVVILLTSALMFASAELMASPLSAIFVEYDKSLFEMTVRGFLIYSFSFLFSGIAIFGSAFFTALNDGLTSALISFLRTLLFQIVAIIVFPLIWELDGIWLSVVATEFLAVVMTLLFITLKRKKYNY